MYVLYVRLVLGISEPKTAVLHILSPGILGLVLPVILEIICRIPVITKNQNIKTKAFDNDAENTDKINTPKIIIIGA